MNNESRATNTEFVSEIMEFSQSGPLMQAFVMTAIEDYTKRVLDFDGEGWPKEHFITHEAWKNCAIELALNIDEHYGRLKAQELP